MVFGTVVYGVDFPLSHLPDLVLVLVVGAASFSALGIAIASFVPNADAGPAIVNAIFFPLVFLSGTFFPVDPDSVLAKIANVFPVRPFLQAIFATFDPLRSGSRLSWGDLAVVAAWGVVAAVIAVRRFRWEPRVT
jgi:ABC-2 type transport system permease protein